MTSVKPINNANAFGDFYSKFKSRRYKKSETLIRADDNPQGIFRLEKGYVRQYAISKSGSELTLNILKPISYFPMVWAINGTPNIYYFEALTQVEVGRAPRVEVVDFIKNKPDLIFSLMSELLVDDTLVAEEVSLAVKKLRRELGFPDNIEFKFHKSRLEVKRKFLETISPYNFRIRAITVKKDVVYSNFLRTSKESFFNYIVMQVLKHSSGKLRQSKLKFDKRGEKRIRNELRVYLSRELDNRNKHLFADLKFVDSKQNVLIQVADMVASCVASYHKGRNTKLYEIIRKRIESDWEFK